MLVKNKLQTLGVASFAALIGAVILSANVFAYGPERQTFTAENPADHVTFNSITNNPTVGDERNFVRVRQAGVGNFADSVDIVPGREYEVYIYYHNNAKSSLNTKENSYRGIALDAKLNTIVPSTISKGGKGLVRAEITARNARPQKVWDEAILYSSSRDVALRYVQGSAKITTKGAVNGQSLIGENLFGAGTNLGYDNLNGILPGCDQYSGVITYRFKADFADFETTKTVSKAGANSFAKNQNIGSNDEVEFKITYKNTGTLDQRNVNIKDLLPAGLTLIPGTTRVVSGSNPNGKIVSDNVVNKGINLGTLTIGSHVELTFRAKIDASKLVCGNNTITNIAQVLTENGGKSDKATITVQKNCTPQERKEFCEVPGKGNLKKNDPNCNDKCTIKGKENLKSNDPKCSEKCKTPGKEGLDLKDPNCPDKCKITGLENLAANDPNCAEVPTELPHTGPAEAAMMVIAIMAITGAVAYWFRSHEEMRKVTAGLTEKANHSTGHKTIENQEAKKSHKEKVEKK